MTQQADPGADPVPIREAHDLAEARHHITTVYIPHELTSHDRRPLDFRLAYLDSRQLTLGHLRYGADVELLCPPMRSCYHVNLTLAGSTQVRQGGHSAATDGGRGGAAFGFAEPYVVRWNPDAVQYAIKIPRTAMESQLAALTGRPVDAPIRFGLGFDLSTARGQSLLAAVRHLQAELGRPGGTAELPLVRAQLESYVIGQMLLVIPHSHRDLLETTGKAAGRTHVRIATEYADEHAAEPITAPDLARAASVSMRALQVGFRDELGVSPAAYIRNVRLDRARQDLLARRAGVPISEIAHRWGFHHLGRFAEHYRRRFGVLPSHTPVTEGTAETSVDPVR
ncbi:MAG: AraC family transcriptional regulator [Pseudonocardia sp. SCN 72-86]|nr:MAG: AraC family transcriptional regulator [Pseudonocardia sp. SCN 72-86]